MSVMLNMSALRYARPARSGGAILGVTRLRLLNRDEAARTDIARHSSSRPTDDPRLASFLFALSYICSH